MELNNLPNVDIFNPIKCAEEWAYCATQQQINVYLNKQLNITKTLLSETITTQEKINQDLVGLTSNHRERIKTLEQEQARIIGLIDGLDDSFSALQADNNTFKQNVDALLDLYQTNINGIQSATDALQVTTQNLWAEVNAIKESIDIDKINAAIAGYEQVLKDANDYTDAITTSLQDELNALDSQVNNNYNELLNKINSNDNELKADIISFKESVNTALNQFQSENNSFRNEINNRLKFFEQDVGQDINRIDARINTLNKKVDDYKIEENVRFNVVENRVTILEQDNEVQKDDIAQQFDELGKINGVLININDTLTGYEEHTFPEIGEELERLDAFDKTLQDGLNANQNGLNQLNTEHERLEKDLKDEIAETDINFASAQAGIEENNRQIKTLGSQINGEFGLVEQLRGTFRKTVPLTEELVTQSFDIMSDPAYSEEYLKLGTLKVETTATRVRFSFEPLGNCVGAVQNGQYDANTPLNGGLLTLVSGVNNFKRVTGYILTAYNYTIDLDFYYEPFTRRATFKFKSVF